jgi:hypothetical protein
MSGLYTAAMEPFKRQCPICGDPAELVMPGPGASTPSASYQCGGCGRRFSFLPLTLLKVMAVIVVASTLTGAVSVWALAGPVTTNRLEGKALGLFVSSAIAFTTSAVALVRGVLGRRASPVVSRF